MSKRRCDCCLYYDLCQESKICGDYVPINDELTDEDVDRIIRKRRAEFLDEWQQYLCRDEC